MHPPDVFLRHAAECDVMAKFTRDPQTSATWRGMAGGVGALNLPSVQAQSYAPLNSREDPSPLRLTFKAQRDGWLSRLMVSEIFSCP